MGSSDRGQTSSFTVSETPTPTSGASGPGFGAGTALGGAAGSGVLAYLHRKYASDPDDGGPES